MFLVAATAQDFSLASKHGIYRYPRMRRQSVIVRAPETFLNSVIWPEFQEINALGAYLAEVTNRLIREAVYKDTGDAEEVPEPAKIPN